MNASQRTRSLLTAILICFVLLTVSLVVYSPIINSYFVADDFGIIGLFMRQRLADVPRLFAADWTQGIWGFHLYELRPVCALSFMWDALWWEVDPLGYHLTNLLVHSANSALVFALLRRLLGANVMTSMLTALLFAVHPVHVEPVSWITARTELISTFFYLGSFLAFGIYRSVGRTRCYVLSLMLFILGLFSKEMVMSLPLMLVAYDIVCRRATIADARRVKYWLPHIGYFTILTLYICLRKFVFGSAFATATDSLDIGDFLLRQSEYLSYLFPPLDMLVGSVGSARVLLPLWAAIFLALSLLLLIHRGVRSRVQAIFDGALRPALFFGVVWYLISVMPLISTYRSARHLYLPSFGLCVAVGLLLPRILTKQRIVRAAFVALIVLCGAESLYYAAQWRQASQLSRQMRDDMQQLVSDVPEGSGIILINMPAYYRGRFAWAWATPFVLREPFSDSNIDRRFRVLDAPNSYCCLWVQDKLPSVLDFIDQPVDSHLIHLDEAKRLRKTQVTKEQVRERLNSIVLPAQSVNGRAFKNPEALAAEWEALWKPHLVPQN